LPPFADLGDLDEDDRIQIIGQLAEGGKQIGFIVENPLKAARYVGKLLARYKVQKNYEGPGPIKGTTLVRVGPKVN
jgi:hypothetical protein